MMCEGCTANEHWRCGMQTWCECDCAGPEGTYIPEIDPYEGLKMICGARRFGDGGPICYQPEGHRPPHIFECDSSEVEP